MKLSFKYICIILAIVLMGCIEEIDLETEAPFESVLVVEGTITNEVMNQEIRLSRSYALEADGPTLESNAAVTVQGSDGSFYEFSQGENGYYYSNMAFAAQPNTLYTLSLQTNDGRQYASSEMALTTNTPIENLYLERGFNENNEEGISIFVDAFDPSGTSKFYRYTYEETYKIIAPFWVPVDLAILDRDPPFAFELQLKEEEQLTCFNTVTSSEIIIENTNQFVEDRVEGFRVRFINRDNYIMSHRYSILVKQFVQSAEAHEFYRTLKEISSENDIFSNLQPGLLLGNMTNVNDAAEPVAGFFEVASVNSQRIYFNYADEFPDEPLPPYVSSCNFSAPVIATPAQPPRSPLIDALDAGFKYFSPNNGTLDGGPYFLVAPPCGNCTVLGSNEPPEFWEE